MEDPERDKFYSAPEPPPDDDDLELELEPPDETIEERQKQLALNAIRSRIDIDEIYRDADRDRGGEILENWFRNFHFQFQLKHMLIATAVLAIAMTLIKLQLFWTTLLVGVMLSVAGLYAYLRLEEKKHEVEADRKRQALYARRRAQMAANMGAPLAEGIESTLAEDVPQPSNAVDEMWQEAAKKEAFHFQFSLREMLLVMTAAAVSLALVRLLGGPSATASLLGLVALGGLVVYACGYEPPQNMVFAWWLILVMYVLISICTAVWGALA
jgi:hypothetical protein